MIVRLAVRGNLLLLAACVALATQTAESEAARYVSCGDNGVYWQNLRAERIDCANARRVARGHDRGWSCTRTFNATTLAIKVKCKRPRDGRFQRVKWSVPHGE
jgi:hypothetical protein